MTEHETEDGKDWPSLISALNPSEEANLVGRLGGRDILLPPNEDRQYPLRGHLWQAGPQARGRVLVMPGFTEFCEKYALFVRRLVGAGYDCLMIDWPGQGRSGQLGAHQLVVHLDHFSTYFYVLDELLAAAGWQTEKLAVFGHSLGGHLALNFAQRFPQLTDKVILSAPMIVPKAPPVWITRLLASALMLAGWRYRALPFVSMPSIKELRKFKLNNPLTRSSEGYDQQYQIFEKQPDLRRVHASVGWIRAAFDSCAATTLNPTWVAAIAAPVLAFLPGDENIVDPAASDRMLNVLPDCHIIAFSEARHELLSELPEVKTRLFAELDQFLKMDHKAAITSALGTD
jgi:lysophospholipase